MTQAVKVAGRVLILAAVVVWGCGVTWLAVRRPVVTPAAQPRDDRALQVIRAQQLQIAELQLKLRKPVFTNCETSGTRAVRPVDLDGRLADTLTVLGVQFACDDAQPTLWGRVPVRKGRRGQ